MVLLGKFITKDMQAGVLCAWHSSSGLLYAMSEENCALCSDF